MKLVFFHIAFHLFCFCLASSQIDSSQVEEVLANSLQNVYQSPENSRNNVVDLINDSTVMHNVYLQSKSYNYLGITFDVLGNNDSALFYYRKSLNISQKNRLKTLIASAKNNMGLIFWNKANYDSAIFYFNKSLVLFEKLKKDEGVASTLNNLGLIYIQERDYKSALGYHQKALLKYQEIENDRGISATLANIGNAYSSLNKRDSSYQYYIKAIHLKKKIKDDYGLGLCYLNVGRYHHENENCDSSFYYNEKARVIFEKFNSKNNLAQIYSRLGENYECFNDSIKADEFYLKAEKLALEVKNGFTLNHLYKKLSKSYAKKKNWGKAYEYLVKYKASSDSIFSIDKSKAIAEVQEKYESAKKDAIIADKELALEIEKNEKNFFILLVSIGLILMVVVVIFIYSIAKRKRKELLYNAQLKSSKEKLRISRDLHDHIGAELTLIKSKLDQKIYSSKSSEDKTSLQEISNYTKLAIDQLRKTIWATKSEDIILDSFVSNLKKYIARYNFTYAIEEEHENNTLSSTIALNLFRVCQEAINNAVKYSNGNKILIGLYQDNRKLTITIKDNGSGFDTSQIEQGYGLDNMRSRMHEIGGTFAVKSTNKGTTVTLSILLIE